MWFDLQPCDPDWGDEAPFSFVNQVRLDAPPEQVFDWLVDPEPWPEWFPDMVSVEWTSDPPHGVGSTRRVVMKQQTVLERFTVFDRGHRWTFYLERATLPLTTRFMEDYRFEAADGGGTLLDWRVHYRPRTLLRPLHPILRPVFGGMFRKGAHALQEWVAARAGT